MSEPNVLYFAYGANRDARMISAILGKPESDLVGRPAVLEGYALAVQRLDQIPDVVAPNAPSPISPRALLKKEWDDDFKSYVIMPKDDSKVVGTIWELTPEDRERVRDWELLEYGWYDDAEGWATTEEGDRISVVTEKLGQGQAIDHVVDGMDYETWLDDPERFRIIAERTNKDYTDRILGLEGSFKDPERKQ